MLAIMANSYERLERRRIVNQDQAVTGGIAASIAAAAEFERQMASVKAVSAATHAEMAALSRKAERLVTATRTKPAVYLKDGRGILFLTTQERGDLWLAVRRFYAWIGSGRLIDPWQSGVANGTTYDRILTKHHKPSGGYDAGQCADADIDHALIDWDGRITSLRPTNQLILLWRIEQGISVDECAKRLTRSPDWVQERWRRLSCYLWHFHNCERDQEP
jgi:hypothetical protein